MFIFSHLLTELTEKDNYFCDIIDMAGNKHIGESIKQKRKRNHIISQGIYQID